MRKLFPEVVLNSGNSISMPLIGMGTATFPVSPSETMKTAILHAIELGYRHIDTAAIYQSEEVVGNAIAEAMSLGLIHSRQELFITSKLWCTDTHHDLVLPALRKTLQNLKLDYLDLYLIHWPVSSKITERKTLFVSQDTLLPMDFKCTWEAMEECQKLGLTRSIGVSNFSCKKLTDLLAVATIPPAVNQVEMHPVWQQKKMREFCLEKGIHISAWSPLGGNRNPGGTNIVMDSPVLKEVAQSKGKSVAQIALRWVFEQGVSLLVKSFRKEHLAENLEILDWELSEEERQKINQLPQQKGFLGESFVSPDGPYKSVEELWDGEI